MGITAAECDDNDDFEIRLPEEIKRSASHASAKQQVVYNGINRDTRDLNAGIEPMWITHKN